MSLSLLIGETKDYEVRFKKNKCSLMTRQNLDIEIAYEDIMEIALPIKLNQEYFIFKISINDISFFLKIKSIEPKIIVPSSRVSEIDSTSQTPI